MENLRKKNQTEIQEIKSPFSQIKMTVEGQSSRLEQVEDRISELKDKIHIKEKNRKNFSQTIQRL
jgi:septation ring formation regulator EzrA